MEMNEPISPRLEIDCPMLVLGGEFDQTVPAEAVVETGKAYGAVVQIFPGVGHNLMLEPTWQEVARCIDHWVQTRVQPNISPPHFPRTQKAT
jgi:pimeloyl-ACP methyl ester carboxylesterase